MRTKLIITNVTALKRKYGTGYAKVSAALGELIAADLQRDITTTLFDVSDAAAMKNVGGTKVTKSRDPKQNKDAFDAVYTRTDPVPDYVMILGSVDVFPHQDLANPLFGKDDDLDEHAWGDLPYACEAPYSTRIRDFIAPTRVVGRLPDLDGAKKPDHLLKVLRTAATWVPLKRKDYADYFALSAEIWKTSTRKSIRKLFGTNANVKLSPKEGPGWKSTELRPLAHFINCHGSLNSPEFSGQPATGEEDYPAAHQTVLVRGNIQPGTVAAVECCYGAQLYKPTKTREHGICQEYLHDDAYGFFGSTTIAYGPADTIGDADIICGAFLKHVLAGSSLGRAALQARQDFVAAAGVFSGVELKTLAQFNLLGDPSIHPVSAAATATPKTLKRRKGVLRKRSASKIAAEQPALDAGHRERRTKLRRRGKVIAGRKSVASKRVKVTADARQRAKETCDYRGRVLVRVRSFSVDRPKPAAKSKTAAASVPKRIFVVTSRKQGAVSAKQHGVRNFSLTVLRESQDGTIRFVREVFAK